MRVLVGALGIALPFLLVLGDGLGFAATRSPHVAQRVLLLGGAELFVGTLSATGVFLVTYKVAERNLDKRSRRPPASRSSSSRCSRRACRPDVDELTPLQDRLGESVVETIHYVAAAAFILSLAVISFFFGVREGARPPREWRALAGVLAALPLGLRGRNRRRARVRSA